MRFNRRLYKQVKMNVRNYFTLDGLFNEVGWGCYKLCTIIYRNIICIRTAFYLIILRIQNCVRTAALKDNTGTLLCKIRKGIALKLGMYVRI